MNPIYSDVHIDAALSNVSTAYMQDVNDFAALKVFPVVNVDKQTNKYWKFNKEDWFRDTAQLRAPATESAGSGMELSTDSYACDNYALHSDLPWEVARNADLDMTRPIAEFLTRKILIRLETEFAANYMALTKWDTDYDINASSTKWDAATGSNPSKDIQTQKTAVKLATGFEPNTLVLTADVYGALKDNSDIIERIKYVGAGGIVEDARLKEYFGVKNIFVMAATKNTAAKKKTDVMTGAWFATKKALLCYVPDAPGLLTPAAGYTFSWGAMTGGAQIATRNFEIDTLMATRYENNAFVDQKLVGAGLGALMYNVIT